MDSLDNDTMPRKQIELNAKYYRLFVPLTYYNSPIVQAFNPQWKKSMEVEKTTYPIQDLFPIDERLFSQTDSIDTRVNKVLLQIYVSHPDLVVTTEEYINSRKPFQKEVTEKLPSKVKMIDLLAPEPINTNVGEVSMLVKKPNFWDINGNGSLQFTQNYISENWYKGGESTNSMLSFLQLNANYDDKQRLEFDNRLEIKLGFITAPSDTMHTYKTNSDLIRLTSKLGVKAINNWYYTVSAEFNTQFFSNYKKNTDVEISSFLAPANFLLSVGMDYKLNKKKVNLSIILSPVSYNFRYVGNKNVDPTAFGLKKGTTMLHDYGSNFQCNMKWQIVRVMQWETRLYYFTNYKKVEAEWENTFNFVLNRYLSTKLFVHARFDDGVKPVKDHSFFQLKELLSFGINYRW
ncbi:MAG: DUF3078 domain-containing protein [Bacteroides sp.]